MSEPAVKMPLPGLGFPGNPDVIRLFEQGLEMARRGEILGVGIVISSAPGHFSMSCGGRNPLELHYACGQLARHLEPMINKPTAIQRVRN